MWLQYIFWQEIIMPFEIHFHKYNQLSLDIDVSRCNLTFVA